MPTITATPFPVEGYVRLDIDYRDTTTSGSTHILVVRRNLLTGEEVQIRPYVAYNSSGCQMLNCLQTLMWDVDPPLNTPVQYFASFCTPTEFLDEWSPTGYDTFTRFDAATWNTSDSGHAWTQQGSGTRSVDGTAGVATLPAANQTHREVMFTADATGNGIVTARGSIGFTPVGGSVSLGLVGRYIDNSNKYFFQVEISTTNTVTLNISKTILGSGTLLDTELTSYVHVPGQVYNMKAQLQGTSLSFTAWPTTVPEPGFFTAFASDGDLPSSTPMGPGTISTTSGAFSSPLPADFMYEQFAYFTSGATPATVSSAVVSVDTTALFLKNPLHPCLDVRLLTCGSANVFGCEDPDARQTVFSQMSEETFAPNSVNLYPVNRRRAIPVVRERRDVEATLTLVTRTFADRDALRASLQPGSPLLFQAPPEYGIADRYMSVGTVSESRGLPDHRFQPRVVQLPHVAVDRPDGPTDGVCGTRFADLCGFYDSWDAMTIVGITWLDILEGDAAPGAPGTPPIYELRTWGDVNDEFASWGAVNTGGRTWGDVLEGA